MRKQTVEDWGALGAEVVRDTGLPAHQVARDLLPRLSPDAVVEYARMGLSYDINGRLSDMRRMSPATPREPTIQERAFEYDEARWLALSDEARDREYEEGRRRRRYYLDAEYERGGVEIDVFERLLTRPEWEWQEALERGRKRLIQRYHKEALAIDKEQSKPTIGEAMRDWETALYEEVLGKLRAIVYAGSDGVIKSLLEFTVDDLAASKGKAAVQEVAWRNRRRWFTSAQQALEAAGVVRVLDLPVQSIMELGEQAEKVWAK